MHPTELEQALREATDAETWVERIAAYFRSHSLHYGHGTDNATDEAYWLVRAVQGWDRDDSVGPTDLSELPRVLGLARARVEQRKPLAYL
ncbi:MAG: 50S ribosomal protein L3 N(5)-glutamine methyltransferase, partial [Gammaproteobacteria bacterium]|nr:50S ribosomal protein L3 N(5)-glutamine methyltransferase [Gammaproteobacteria bacterium]